MKNGLRRRGGRRFFLDLLARFLELGPRACFVGRFGKFRFCRRRRYVARVIKSEASIFVLNLMGHFHAL